MKVAQIQQSDYSDKDKTRIIGDIHARYDQLVKDFNEDAKSFAASPASPYQLTNQEKLELKVQKITDEALKRKTSMDEDNKN